MMTLQEIIANISSGYWINETNSIVQHRKLYTPNEDDLKLILREFEKWLRNYKHGRATNWFVLGFIFYHDQFINQIRKTGLFRPSKYSFNNNTARFVVNEALKCSEKLCLSETTISYLQSSALLHKLSSGVIEKIRRISMAIRDGKDVFLKGMIATVDYVFMKRPRFDKSLLSSKIDFYSAEQLAEGLSYILHLYNEIIGVPSNMFIDEDKVLQDEYPNLLIDAIQVRIFQEFEVFVDTLNYRISFDSQTNTARLYSPDPLLEMSYRLGYIQVSMRKDLDLTRDGTKKVLSLKAAGSLLGQKFGDKLVELKRKPIPRYVFQVPMAEELINFFKGESLFEEELLVLKASSRELMVNISEIKKFIIYKNVSLWDLLKVQRLFNFIRWYSVAYLEPLIKTNPGIVLQSLVPSYTDKSLQELLNFIVEPEKSKDIIDFLTWIPENSQVCDIQYQPIIKTQKGYLVPTNVFASSHIIRNSLFISHARFYQNGSTDPISTLLFTVLNRYTKNVSQNIKFRSKYFTGEIDVIALMDKSLFIFECKNSLLPCNSYEIRTSYDSIVKAAIQLSKFQEAFKNNEFMEIFEENLKWPIRSVTKVFTCIVVGNRMFSGYRIDGHPVRANYEIANFINEGIVVNQEGKKVSLWIGEKFTTEDLQKYIAEDSVHKPIFDSMEKYIERYPFGKYMIEFETYCLNTLSLHKKLGFSLPDEFVKA